MWSLLLTLLRKDDGASMVEYTVLLGLVLAGVIALIVTVGTEINTVWTTLSTTNFAGD